VAGSAVLVAAVAVLSSVFGGNGIPGPPAAQLAAGAPDGDPLLYRSGRDGAFAARAAAGSAQVLFLKSPGGVAATAARVARYRPLIVAAVRGTAIPADALEGLVFLESAGRPDAIAGTDPSAAAGLTQILAGTGASLLGMHIDLPRSRRLTAAIGASAADPARVARLERRRARIDDRFDPARELAATVRYLEIARSDLGRLDLALVAYHSGIGNLQRVLSDYDGGHGVSYAQLYFDIAPNRHAAAWRLLASLGDDSSLYLWRILEAERIMRLYRADPAALGRLAGLETGWPSTAQVIVPPSRFPEYADPGTLSAAYRQRAIVPLPRNAQALGLRYDPSMGSLAGRVGAPRALYRGLRPAALGVLIEMAALVRRLSGAAAPLIVTRTVVDRRYDSVLGVDDQPATTGYTFQIERRYASGAQAQALQFVLDRLQALNLIGWIRGSDAIEVTVAPDAVSVLRRGP
jgi:hypothetical protein